MCKYNYMKVFLYTMFAVILAAAACSDSNSPAVSAIIDSEARRDAVITDTKGSDTIPHMDTTRLLVDAASNITINGTPLPKAKNAVYRALYDNWLHAYTLVNHLPAVLHIAHNGTAPLEASGDMMDQIVRAQENMQQYIAKDKYKKSYSSLSPEQQVAMQKQHAILFQKEFK
jgi:hypothetical protein